MALIKCPECGKEISDQAITCPNCGCPISLNAETTIKTISRSQPSKKERPLRKKMIIVLSISGCILLIGIANSVFSDSSETPSDEVQIEDNTQKEALPVVPDTVESETSQVEELQPEINETNKSEENQNNVVGAFKQGFEDNFNISEENQENIDSIQESVSEIVNDEEVQEAYEGWKESINKLFGGE